MINPKTERDARKILDTIGSILVGTSSGLGLYTCGDAFRRSILETKKDIYDIYDYPKFKEKIVLGDFGSGKSHFLECLYYFLKEDLSEKKHMREVVISRVDLTSLNTPEELELKIVEGMEFPDGQGVQVILKEAYLRITGQSQKKAGIIKSKKAKQAYINLLLGLLGYAATGFSTVGLEGLVLNSNFINSALNLSKNLINRSKQPKDIQLSDAQSKDKQFIEAYLKIISNSNYSYAGFREAAFQLSRESRLIDLILKILKLAEVKMIVILMDELESLNRKDDNFLRSCLESIRGFRDDFNKVLSEKEHYPPAAFIATSTDLFFHEELRLNSTALHSRWRKIPHVILEPMSDSDIDNLIFDLRKLYFFAGYNLKSLKGYQNGNEVMQLRENVKDRIANTSQTTRGILVEIKREIEKHWLE